MSIHTDVTLSSTERRALQAVADRVPTGSRAIHVCVEDGSVVALSIRDAGLTSLPEEIGGLGKLRRLDLTGNHLASLPRSIGSLPELTHVYLTITGSLPFRMRSRVSPGSRSCIWTRIR